DDDALSVYISELVQCLLKRSYTALGIFSRGRRQEADPWSLLRLRPGGERRKQHAESETNREPDPLHGHLVEMAGGESSRSQQPGSVVLLMSAPGCTES